MVDITKAKKIQTFDGKPAKVIQTNLAGKKSVLIVYNDQYDNRRSAQVTITGHMNKDYPFVKHKL